MLLLQLVVIPVSVVVKLLECEGEYRRGEDLNDDAGHIIEVPAHSVDGKGEQVSVAFIEILRVIVVSLIIICSVVRRLPSLGCSLPATASPCAH